jgi:hypothetical protein
MTSRNRILDWLVRDWNWPAASLLAGCLLLLAAPAWLHVAGLALTLVWVQLPIYMFHQWEEHAGDRFRRYVNRPIAGGHEALTPVATFWINVLGVWAVDLAALYLACFVHPSLGLVAIYLPLVNSLGHIGPAIARREYNPGLWTAVGLFLPIGGFGLWTLAALGASWLEHGIGLGLAVAVHAAIIAHVARRLASFSATRPVAAPG